MVYSGKTEKRLIGMECDHIGNSVSQLKVYSDDDFRKAEYSSLEILTS